MRSVVISCANGQCGQQLGTVGPSVRSGNPRPVWKIRPGWVFPSSGPSRGVLEYVDETYKSERRMYHEVTGGLRPEGMGMFRECDLPLCVRCPRCHRMRWVAPDVVFALAR